MPLTGGVVPEPVMVLLLTVLLSLPVALPVLNETTPVPVLVDAPFSVQYLTVLLVASPINLTALAVLVEVFEMVSCDVVPVPPGLPSIVIKSPALK
jgi:hypothetical protein